MHFSKISFLLIPALFASLSAKADYSCKVENSRLTIKAFPLAANIGFSSSKAAVIIGDNGENALFTGKFTFLPTRVGAAIQYEVSGETGEVAHLNLTQFDTIVTGHCGRAGCEPKVISKISGTLTYLGKEQKVACVPLN